MTKKTLNGPGGISIVLDSSEIFPDDPGMGTPAMVYIDKHSATFNCALGEGELDFGEKELTTSQMNWLESQDDVVSNFINEHTS